MTTDLIPTCLYHPVKVIFLDDNRSFLDAIELEFNDRINMTTFTNTDDALREIDKNSRDIYTSILKVDMENSTNQMIYFWLNKAVDYIYDYTRFDTAAVLVVDYEMPNMNGIEFCKKIKDKNIFKIMLTAEADMLTAVDAFNKGLINKFILKTDENLYQNIMNSINEAKNHYFFERSKMVITSSDDLRDLFNNTVYKKLFNQISSRTKAIEYYLIDQCGSFLFLDKEAAPTWLVIRHSKDLQEQAELLEGYDVPEPIVSSIRKNEKMMFLFSDNEYKKPVSNWINNIFDSTKLDNDYYYTVIHKKLTKDINWDNVARYKK